jgi:hypothetical protein
MSFQYNNQRYAHSERRIYMADISSAYGTMTLVGEWSQDQIMALNHIAYEIWSGWYYDIDVLGAFSTRDRPVPFHGNGKWRFENSLNSIGTWSNDKFVDKPTELRVVYNDLIACMEAYKLSIDIAFHDEESCAELLYKQEGTILARNGLLVYEKRSEENFEYTWRNIIDVTGDREFFDELIASLAYEAGVPWNSIGEIETWALENTTPHSTEFRDLSGKQQADFKKLFCNKHNAVI